MQSEDLLTVKGKRSKRLLLKLPRLIAKQESSCKRTSMFLIKIHLAAVQQCLVLVIKLFSKLLRSPFDASCFCFPIFLLQLSKD